MFDISKIKTKPRTIEIVNPSTGTDLGIRVTMVSVDDDRLGKLKREITDRRLHLEARGKTFKADELEDNKNRILFTSVIDWEWYNPTGKPGDDGYDPEAQASFGGAVPDFTQREFIKIIKELPWFGDQINEAIGDTKSFFDQSA